jgi:Bax protein
MVPRARAPGKRHEVATYDSAQASVASYLLNLNTNEDYEALRERRAELRAAGRSPRGVPLAECLPRYSERRRAYVNEIQSLIDFNELENDS